jgi:hypothetical protein
MESVVEEVRLTNIIVELQLLQKLELRVEVCSRNYRIYPFHANIWLNRWIKKPTLAAVLDMVGCALCFGVSDSRHQPQVKIGLPSFRSEILRPVRKLVIHFAAHFPVWKSINTRTSFLTSTNQNWKQSRTSELMLLVVTGMVVAVVVVLLLPLLLLLL